MKLGNLAQQQVHVRAGAESLDAKVSRMGSNDIEGLGTDAACGAENCEGAFRHKVLSEVCKNKASHHNASREVKPGFESEARAGLQQALRLALCTRMRKRSSTGVDARGRDQAMRFFLTKGLGRKGLLPMIRRAAIALHAFGGNSG